MRNGLCAAAACALAFAACSGSGATGSAGTITAAGSTAMLPLVKEAADRYQSAHSNVKISVSGGGSRVGITQTAQRAIDIGDSDIPPVNEPALVDHKVAVVPFAVVVNPKSGVRTLTIAQLRGIFSGAIANFSQVGGADVPVTIVNRARSSGTRAVFVATILGGHQPSAAGLTQDSSGTVAQIVSQTPGAIAYISLSYVKPGRVNAVAIHGVMPTTADVENGRYPYWSYEHMLTNGQPSAAVAAFINYVKTEKSILTRMHFLPVSEMKITASDR